MGPFVSIKLWHDHGNAQNHKIPLKLQIDSKEIMIQKNIFARAALQIGISTTILGEGIVTIILL